MLRCEEAEEHLVKVAVTVCNDKHLVQGGSSPGVMCMTAMRLLGLLVKVAVTVCNDVYDRYALAWSAHQLMCISIIGINFCVYSSYISFIGIRVYSLFVYIVYSCI